MRRLAQRAANFIRLGRPLFLAGGFVFYALGAAVALHEGRGVWWAGYAVGQLAVTATQLMTHYANDYFDQANDRANDNPTPWSGGSRVLLASALPGRVALIAALSLAGVALAAGGVLAALGRPAALVIVALGAALAWGYSAPPLRLHSTGLGEVVAAGIVTVLTPMLSCVVQIGRAPALLGLAIAPVFLLQVGMLLTVEFPDEASDRSTGKRTLTVRLGGCCAAWLYVGLLGAAYGALALAVLAGLPQPAGALAALMLPVALFQAARVARGAWSDRSQQAGVALWGIALLVGTGALETLGLLLAVGGWRI